VGLQRAEHPLKLGCIHLKQQLISSLSLNNRNNAVLARFSVAAAHIAAITAQLAAKSASLRCSSAARAAASHIMFNEAGLLTWKPACNGTKI